MSKIDHFFWSENISQHVNEADVLHLPGNMSDHCPIFCIVSLHKLIAEKNVTQKQRKMNPSWKMATDEQKEKFKKNLEHRLKAINNPRSHKSCQNVHCADVSHQDECDMFLVDILDSIKSAAATDLPTPEFMIDRKKKSSILNWNVEVQPFKDKAFFWHAVWVSAGRPVNTVLHHVMKRTRNVYHYRIRKSRRAAECIKKNTLLDACINDKGDIFKEIKKLRKSPPTVASSIDGISNNIDGHFANIYEKLYSAIDDSDDLLRIANHLEMKIDPGSMIDVERITPSIIKEAISKLKNDKTDPLYQFNSECMKYAPEILHQLLSDLFHMLLIHGHISSIVMVSTVIPLIKDKLGDINSSNNYRSIALSSLVLKIFDWVVLL